MNQQTERGENPRTTRVRHVILDAAIDLLAEHGAGEVTATRISRETGVARTTIYRHWPDQPSLVLDTVEAIVAPHGPTTVTADLEADLILALTNLRTRMTKHPFRRIFAALLGLADRDERFVVAQQRFVNGVLRPVEDVLDAAIRRDDLPPTVDISNACATLAGPLLHQHVMLHGSISDALIEEIVARFLHHAAETNQWAVRQS